MASGGRGRVSSAKAGLFITQDSLSPTIRAMPNFVRRSVFSTLRYYEPKVESAAKINAPWTDQTTNARNGLIAKSGQGEGEQYIILAHRVPYGIFLETRFAAKNAIIMPTLNAFLPQVLGTLQGILNRKIT